MAPQLAPARVALLLAILAPAPLLLWAQDKTDEKQPPRGSIVEDRLARKLLEAGDDRLAAREAGKAVEVWQSVIERYPRSKVRHEAHLRLGNHLLEKERAYDRARTHFETVAADDNPDESHLYFDPGDGRLITVFTNEGRAPDPERTPTDPGCVHHLAFALSQATFAQTVERLDERAVEHSGVKDRGFMDSIYFKDPLGLLIELASYRFEPPAGHTHAEVLLAAHRIRVQRGDYNIAPIHLADAIERLVTRSQRSLSEDRSARDPYAPRRD